MLKRLKSLIGYTMSCSNGTVGRVEDFLFDDHFWAVRYVQVDTGTWLPGRQVILSPESIGVPVKGDKALPVNLTVEEIKSAPDIATDEPIERHHEEALASHFGWSRYWLKSRAVANVLLSTEENPEAKGYSDPSAFVNPYRPTEVDAPGFDPQPMTTGDGLGEVDALERAEQSYDSHLRSIRHVIGYDVCANADNWGLVHDVIADMEEWSIPYLVIDTGRLLPGRKVLVATSRIDSSDWHEGRITVDHESG